MKQTILFVFVMVLAYGCAGSGSYLNDMANGAVQQLQPREIFADSDYVHTQTQIVFPETYKNFTRDKIIAYDDQGNISGSYTSLNAGGDSSRFTVYIYPAGEPTQNRLRVQYYTNLEVMASFSDSDYTTYQYVLPYEKDGYRLNGYYGEVGGDPYKTSLTLFECGKWFLKYRIATNSNETGYMENLRDSLIESFNPVEIVKKDPLVPDIKMYISDVIVYDSLFTDAMMEQALCTAEWVEDNIDSLEMCAGVPSSYLEFYSEPLKRTIEWYDEHKEEYPEALRGNEYLSTIKMIIDSGYLNEFLMDWYYMMLIPRGDDVQLWLDDYYVWRDENIPGFEPDGFFFMIGY